MQDVNNRRNWSWVGGEERACGNSVLSAHFFFCKPETAFTNKKSIKNSLSEYTLHPKKTITFCSSVFFLG